ncbi:MAG: hypothetical protein IPH97_13460 [Ignavibacteriales bacterium]|nr:hypothetical protein [Ignavibacteriales bacterium]
MSLSGKIDPFNEDHFILPFIEINNNADEKGAETYINLWGIPKDISHKYLKPQDGIDQDTLKDQPLTYEHLRDYERIASLSEQFLTPLIQKILNSISGFGTPDYHSIIQKMIKENIQEMFS